MGGYIANFAVYTMAMIGLICFAVFVYKKFMSTTASAHGAKYLSVEESMSLTPRKTLHVVRAGNEKFLIASDVDRTTLISRLEWNKVPIAKNLDYVREIPVEEDVIPLEPVSKYKSVVNQNNASPNVRQVKKRQLDSRAGASSQHKVPVKRRKTVTLDFEIPKSNGFHNMKDMAKKINEL